ncbi:flagellar biosynthesis protein FliQ [Elstera cyanobacteriorum]|uniref:Flagellar biosynthetic protein FliQ n=1 Tax=Elstera cyanobacteriorum TaxID=2022747 RepID=A0A255XR54_9PROT|nr:flagellar biosynthesis protein FliQ [Elstera cyanobacteriorum]MCK6442093.1 flagellar biosynthesis protein FliQ [Elstera cyanobacteriorum]OYQ18730.1 flagellar biosynthetic protein FliQ [Elstera cyanobacteriorum]GFZ78100.1 flagellar biosynthesis protein FliQ [Elstera cyanobacteriorum]
MNEATTLEVAREAVLVLLQVSGPIMVISLLVGLIISLFQALTQIQEMTLTFVPKIIVVFISLLLLFPFMLATMKGFMERLVDRIISLG